MFRGVWLGYKLQHSKARDQQSNVSCATLGLHCSFYFPGHMLFSFHISKYPLQWAD